MKKNYLLAYLSILLSFAIQAQVTYSGNGNSGFGDVFGSTGNIQITDDGSQISFTLNKGLGGFNDTMVIYIDSKAGGFSDTSTFTDTADGLRKGVSGYDGTNRSTVNFPTGFTADYAIAVSNTFAGLWTLDNVASFTFINSANLSPTGTATSATYTFNVNFSELGITSTDNFKFVATYLNATSAFRSDEAIGDGIASGSPGQSPVTFTGDRSYPNTWTGTTNNDWATATNWTEGVPSATHNVFIPMVANQPTATSAVTINKGIIKSGASVIAQSTFIGNISYNVHVGDTNWHLISSPVVNEQYDNTWVANNLIASGSVSTTNRAISPYQNGPLNGTTGPWTYFQAGGAATTFSPAVGYSLKRTGAGDYTFTGTFPTTAVSPAITQSSSNWNLIGNPYPSYLDVAAFITANSTNLTVAFSAVYVFNGTIFIPLSTGYIHPGQAFFINSKVASGNAVITEAMQSHQTGITFYKSATPSINLTVFNGTSTKKTAINYLDGKTTSLDPGFDIGMFDGVASDLRIYTHLISNDEGISFARQALPNTNLESMVVPIGVKAAANKEITFSAEGTNLPTGIKIFLEDRTTNTFTRLNEANSNYKVTLADAVNGTGRFYLHTSQKALSVDTNVILNTVSIYKTNKSTLRISGLQQGKANIKIFNILGKKMINYSFKTNGVQDISLPQLATGIYIVELTTKAGKLNKKIVLQ